MMMVEFDIMMAMVICNLDDLGLSDKREDQ